jgi:hypothetical protein
MMIEGEFEECAYFEVYSYIYLEGVGKPNTSYRRSSSIHLLPVIWVLSLSVSWYDSSCSCKEETRNVVLNHKKKLYCKSHSFYCVYL